MTTTRATRSVKWATSIGAAAGAILLGALGSKLFGAPGASIGAPSGAVLGGVAGLDLLLPAPMRPSVGHHKGPTMGPFCSAVTFAVVGIVSALFGCYSVGTLTLTCSHAQLNRDAVAAPYDIC